MGSHAGVGPVDITITPFSGSRSSATLIDTIYWCLDNLPASPTRTITLNGVTLSQSSYNFVSITRSGCTYARRTIDTLTLSVGTNTLTAELHDVLDNFGTKTETYTYGDVTKPTLTAAPVSATYAPATVIDTIEWCDETSLNDASRSIKWRGAVLSTASYNYTTIAKPGCAAARRTVDTLSLIDSVNTLVATIADGAGNVDSVTRTYRTFVAPVVTAAKSSDTVVSRADKLSTFWVRNPGSATTTYYLTPSCSTLIVGSACTAPSSLTLVGRDSAAVTVGYTAGSVAAGAANGSATVGLKAFVPADTTRQSASQTALTVTPLPTIEIFSAGVPSDRSLCLMFDIAGDVATQCGTIRLTHALPPVRTRNRVRTPTLVYSSEWVTAPVIGTIFRAPGTARVDSVRYTIARVRPQDGTYADSSSITYRDTLKWTATRERLLSLQMLYNTTGVVRYRATVQAWIGGSLTTYEKTGTYASVYRVDSGFGAGWWLGGVEQIVRSAYAAGTIPDTVLWIGGDGSARIFGRIGSTNNYVTKVTTRPDTLQRLTGTGAALWVHRTAHRDSTVFDSSGRHIQTGSPAGTLTTIAWAGLDSVILRSITVPGGLTYRLARGSGTSYVDTWTAPGPNPAGGDSVRRVYVYRDTLTLHRGIQRIMDPDSATTRFAFLQWGTGLNDIAVGSITNARGTTPTLDWVAFSPDLRTATTPAGGGTNVVHAFRTPRTGTNDTTLTRADSIMVFYDGPRDAAAPDTIHILVNGYGAPTSIRNALGQVTRVRRQDPAFPGLATETISASGLVSRASYDAAGNLAKTVVLTPFGNAQDAVATYAWDAVWNKPTALTPPSGVVTTTAYNSSTGLPLWTQTGGDTTKVHYNGNLQVDSVKSSNGAIDRYHYESQHLNLDSAWTPRGYRSVVTTDWIGRVTATEEQTENALPNRSVTLYDLGGRDTLTKTWRDTDTLAVAKSYYGWGQLHQVTQRALPARAPAAGGGFLSSTIHSYTYDTLGRKSGEGTGGAIQLSFHYDAADNLITGGPTLRGTDSLYYDALNRVVRRTGTDSAAFTYDLTGGIRTANNRDAKVSRTYFANGAIRGDTVWVANTARTSFDGPYGIEYAYDVAGRPITLRLPVLRFESQSQFSYAYDTRTGQIGAMGAFGGTYSALYDLMGRRDSLFYPDGTKEGLAFDIESNVTTRLINLGATSKTESITRDARGRATAVSATDILGQGAVYDGLGHATQIRTSYQEDFTYDALGNRISYLRSNTSRPQNNVDNRYTYYALMGWLQYEVNLLATNEHDTTFYTHDVNTGDRVAQESHNWFFNAYAGGTDSGYVQKSRTNTYANSGLMSESKMVQHKIWVAGGAGWLDTTYTEIERYRYDALGRRVRRQMIYGTYCEKYNPHSACISTTTTQIWDGSQLLAELGVTSDTGYVAGSGMVPQTEIYLHTGRTDHPLASSKGIPYENWLGRYGYGTCGGTACQAIQAEAGGFGVFTWQDQPAWRGSLWNGMQDGSGYTYQRNRYLDAATGAFTQADPIGLAGGLNLYGYAGGDPLTFSDPWGLCFFGLPCPQGLVDASAGFGDALLFGAGPTLRRWAGAHDAVNMNSRAYAGGVVVGAVALTAATAGVAAEANAARGGAAAVRLGQAGEAAVREAADIGGKVAIRVAGRTRIPDGLTGEVLTEVKNVQSLSYTRQLRDFAQYAQDKGLRFDLWVRAGAELSTPLQEAIQSGAINLRTIP